MKYACPCCGYYTYDHKPNGTYEICEVCFWEDDPIQLKDPYYAGGANRVSLVQGRINFKRFASCEEQCVPYVRKPNPDELSP